MSVTSVRLPQEIETPLNDLSKRLDRSRNCLINQAIREFIERHKDWGTNLRIFDAEVRNVNMADPEHATAFVDYSWGRLNEATVRTTRVAQVWENIDGEGWVLHRESRHSGDFGLLGENVVQAPSEPHRDVHFPSRTIGAR